MSAHAQAFIAAENGTHSVSQLCGALGVSASGYYAHKRRPESVRCRRDRELVPKVRRAFIDSRKTYGSPRIHRELNESGEQVGRHRVARLMRENGLDARPKRKFRVVTTDSKHGKPFSPNRLLQDFSVTAPNKVWVGDVTYIETEEGWVYLAAFIDLYARRVVGYALADHKRDELTLLALRRALAVRDVGPELVFHSDRGGEFASDDFRAALVAAGFEQSMSAAGNCYDNAVSESFFASLEKDVLLRTVFETRGEAMGAITDYIQNFYNPIRRHSHNGLVSPQQAERNFANAMGALAA